jgi:tetratricopeptide (TPR) repeat protein
MRTRWCLLLMVFVLAGIPAGADTVKLKDGTVLEGDITAEDGTTLSIYLEFSNGTITQTRQINKTDIARIIRWTPEQRAQHDYERLQRYQLSSNDSFQVEYYDQIIDGVFRKFLTQHPHSPLASNVTERIMEWKAERNLVAAGNVKFHGRWSPIEEAAAAIQREHGQRLLQDARSLISHGRFESAIQQLQQVVHMNGQPELVSQAKPLLASACQMAATLLEQQRQQLEKDVSSAQQRLEQANQALNQATASQQQAASSAQPLGTPRSAHGDSYQALGASSQSFMQAQMAVNKAHTDHESAQNHLEQLKSQLDVVTQKLTALKSPALAEYVVASAGPPTNGAPPAASAPAPTSPAIADLPGPVADIVSWAKKNYVALVIIGLVLVYVMSRITKG